MYVRGHHYFLKHGHEGSMVLQSALILGILAILMYKLKDGDFVFMIPSESMMIIYLKSQSAYLI